MIINKCLIASDLKYSFLYQNIRKGWLKLGIQPILILIATEIPKELKEFENEIILFKPIPDIHTAFISQCIRILYPSLFPNDNIIISDMDIYPVSKEYFVDSVKDIPEDKIITYREKCGWANQFPLCYILAKGSTWKEFFNVNSEEDIIQVLKEWYPKGYTGEKNCPGWFSDQEKLYEKLNGNEKLVILGDKKLNFKRLDKRQRTELAENFNYFKQNINIFTDFHLGSKLKNARFLELIKMHLNS